MVAPFSRIVAAAHHLLPRTLFARSRLAGGGRHTLLDTASLVNETYLRMQRDGGVRVNDSEHFMAYAASTMRSIVIDFVVV